MRRAWWVVVGWWLSSCAAHRFECERHGSGAVVRVDSEHFSVTSDLAAPDMRFEVRRLERLWDAFSIYFQRAPQAGDRLRVLLSHGEAAGEFVPDTAGFVTHGLAPLMVTTVTKAKRRGASSTNAHELVHVMSRHWLPRQPRWISEGLAEYLGDANFLSEYKLSFGRWRWRDGGRVEPLLTLWAWDEGRGTHEQELDHYQSAWAWLHYLVSREGPRLNKVWAALAADQPPRAAFEAIFPPAEYDELQQKVQQYVNEGRFRSWEVNLVQDHALSEPTPVSPWEVHLLRRDVASATGWVKKAKAESAMAREVSPSPLPVEVSLALALDALHGPDLTDELSRLPPGPQVLLELGAAVDGSPAFQLETLQRTTVGLPNSARAHLGLARVSLRLGDPGALAAAQRAVRLAPWNVEARLLEARAHEQAGHCAEALRALDAARALAVEGEGWQAQGVAEARKKLLASCEEKP